MSEEAIAEDSQEEEQDLTEQLTAAYDEALAKEEGPEPDPVAETVSKEPSDGEGEVTEVQPETTDPEPISPPASWTKEKKEQFTELPRHLQEYVVERDLAQTRDYTKKTEEAGEVRRRYGWVDEVLQPYQELIQSNSINPAQLFSNLLAAERALSTNPEQAFLQLAQNKGLDLRKLVEAQGQTPVIDQNVVALQRQVQNLNQQLQQQTQSAQQQQQTAAESAIQAFTNEADEAGELLRPYLSRVETQMIPIVQLLKGQNPGLGHVEALQQAYEKAIWADPEIRSELLQRELATKQAAEKAKAEQAASKAVSLNGAPSGTTTKSQPKDLRSELEQAWDAALG